MYFLVFLILYKELAGVCVAGSFDEVPIVSIDEIQGFRGRAEEIEEREKKLEAAEKLGGRGGGFENSDFEGVVMFPVYRFAFLGVLLEVFHTLVREKRDPGEIFGEMAYLDETQRTDYAVTVESSMICAINKNDLAAFIEKNPELNLKLTRILGLKLRSFSERIEDLIFKDAHQRVASFILRYADKNGRKVGDQIFVKPFLKHQNIGELTACSRQTVNYILTDLRSKGIIDFDRNKLIINKPDEIKKIIS